MIRRYATATAFLDAAAPFLVRREAEHNLMFGISATAAAAERRGDAVDPPAYFATVTHLGQTVGAAVMTPPWHVVLSCMEAGGSAEPVAEPAAELAAELAADLASFDPPTPGVLAPVEVARAFATVWCEPRGLLARRTMAERIYRLERVVPPIGVPGHARVAASADRGTLIDFVDAFLGEADGKHDHDEARSLVDRGLGLGERTFFLWEDGGSPVSLAAAGGPTPNGIRIGPVYTPPARRGRGYASAVTAAASQAQLDQGRRFVFLFTNLANPTANRIYQAIGYEPVSDMDQLLFEAR